MKKIFITVLALLSVVMVANAQLGVRVGYTASNLSINNSTLAYTTSVRSGFEAGATYSIALPYNLYIEPGIMYTTAGAKIENNTALTSASAKINMSYLKVPLTVGYNAQLLKGLALRPFVGLYAGYALSAKAKDMKGSIAGITFGKNDEYDLFDINSSVAEYLPEVNKFDAGFRFGLGANVSEVVYVGVACDFGFVNMNKNAKYDATFKNKGFVFSVGYNF